MAECREPVDRCGPHGRQVFRVDRDRASTILDTDDSFRERHTSTAKRRDSSDLGVIGPQLTSHLVDAISKERHFPFHVAADLCDWIARVHPNAQRCVRLYAKRVEIVEALSGPKLIFAVTDVNGDELLLGGGRQAASRHRWRSAVGPMEPG